MDGQEIKVALGQNIKNLRAHRLYSQAELAEKANICHQARPHRSRLGDRLPNYMPLFPFMASVIIWLLRRKNEKGNTGKA